MQLDYPLSFPDVLLNKIWILLPNQRGPFFPIIKNYWVSPGEPVIGTQGFYICGPGSIPGLETEIPLPRYSILCPPPPTPPKKVESKREKEKKLLKSDSIFEGIFWRNYKINFDTWHHLNCRRVCCSNW